MHRPLGVPGAARCKSVAHVLAPGTERLVSYHLVTDGKAVVRFPGEEDIAVMAGDILIIPHGDAHTVSNGSPSTFLDSGASLGKFLAGSLTTMRLGGGGEMTRFVCGYFGCERHADRLFLAGLPLMIKINLRGDAGRRMAGELGSPSRLPGRIGATGTVGPALQDGGGALHRDHSPLHGGVAAGADRLACGCAGSRSSAAHWRCCTENPVITGPWSELAAETGVSRSVLAERFSRFLGEPPLTYLARWRLQLAARMLQTTREAVMQVASEVGYDSEAAFNRAFKREFGIPPGQFRAIGAPDRTWLEATGERAFRARCEGIQKVFPFECLVASHNDPLVPIYQ